MAQTGIHAIIGLKSKTILPKGKWFFVSIIIGSLVPDIDILLVIIASIFTGFETAMSLFRNSISHSIFTSLILFFIILIIYEVKKDKKIRDISIGILIGFTFHIMCDLIWFEPIHFLWPLPLDKLNLFASITIPLNIKVFMYALEFLFFRLFGWILLQKLIDNPKNNNHIIIPLTKWIKYQSYLFLFFLILIFFQIRHILFMYVFGIFFIPSLLFAIYLTFMLRNSLSEGTEYINE